MPLVTENFTEMYKVKSYNSQYGSTTGVLQEGRGHLWLIHVVFCVQHSTGYGAGPE